jgi:hypothetical protein
MGPLLQLLWNLSGISVPIALVAWIVARRRKYGGGYVPDIPKPPAGQQWGQGTLYRQEMQQAEREHIERINRQK